MTLLVKLLWSRTGPSIAGRAWKLCIPLSRSVHRQPQFGAQWDTQSPNPGRVVLVSTSTSIFENLALESWLYEHGDLDSWHYLLLWRNTPAVVIGRHQNPWLEANVPSVLEAGMDLARRQSGGGTVYHDLGNLNLSFLTSRRQYHRRRNLELVVRALTERWDIDLSINTRDDILLNGLYKVSGTASKLGGKRAYHHFTLLLDVDKWRLHHFLQSPCLGVDTKATQSVPASTLNLCDVEPAITYEAAVAAISDCFLQSTDPLPKAGGTNYQEVDPMDEASFPGVGKLWEDLSNPDWVFGKSPKFSIRRTFSRTLADGSVVSIAIDAEIVKGRVESLNWQISTASPVPPSWERFASSAKKSLLGLPLWGDHVRTALENAEVGDSDDLTEEFYRLFVSSLGECLLA